MRSETYNAGATSDLKIKENRLAKKVKGQLRPITYLKFKEKLFVGQGSGLVGPLWATGLVA